MDHLPEDTDIEDETLPNPKRRAILPVISHQEEKKRAKDRPLLFLLARLFMWSVRCPRNLTAMAIMKFEISVRAATYLPTCKKEITIEEVKNEISLPHVHAFTALARAALEKLSAQSEAEQIVNQAMRFWVAQQIGMGRILECVPHVRLVQKHQPQKMKLEIAVPTYQVFEDQPSLQVWVIVKQEMEKDGVRMLRGKALRGHMESEITTWVEEQE